MMSIVIPLYNNLESAQRLLRSVYKQFDRSRGEVIVVDDGSTGCDTSVLEGEFSGLKIIRLEKNAGASNARNIGARNAAYDIILFLDADMELCGGAIDEAERSMAEKGTDAVVGTITDTPLNRGIFQDYWAILKSYFQSLPRERSSTFYPMVGAIRKEVFDAVGGFDARIKGASIEDYEISMRIDAAGYKVRYNPGMIGHTSYKGFLTTLLQSCGRAKKWAMIFLGRLKFDNHTTTASQGLGNLLGFLTLLLLAFSAVFRFLLPVAAAVLLGLVYVNRGFFMYVIRRRGPLFFVVSVLFYLVFSLFITLGSLSAFPYIFRSEKSRREVLYG